MVTGRRRITEKVAVAITDLLQERKEIFENMKEQANGNPA
jgi:plasmid maintenance system antidote protein VapI